jgi:hypothetical protein
MTQRNDERSLHCILYFHREIFNESSGFYGYLFLWSKMVELGVSVSEQLMDRDFFAPTYVWYVEVSEIGTNV